jgi:hypothetical protein
MKSRTLLAVEQQINAMGCEVYEIGLFKPHVPGSGSREPEMLPRTWDSATLLKSVPWLRYQNSQGRNIYIRPKGEHHLSMVDDLTAEAVKRMKTEGFAPSLVVETSPGNFQAWVNHGEILPQRLSTLAARAIAEKFDGDRGAADWRHFGRLAGFTNRKQKYQGTYGDFPFVKIIGNWQAAAYTKAAEFLATIRKLTAQRDAELARSTMVISDRRLLSIDDFRANPTYAGDGNRIDLAYAVYALSHGLSTDSVTQAIRSRDLSKKGSESRQADYSARTIAKAQARVENGR